MFFSKQKPADALYVWLVAGLAFAVKCWWVFTTSMRGIATTTWLIDDSFIEMRVAQNLGLGHGFSLDGIHATTGAPFLWIYTSALNHMFLGVDAAIRATLLETALFGGLAAIIVFFLALKLTEDRRIAWTAFVLSTFTANAFFNALNGMDTAMFTLFVVAAIAAYFEVGKPKHWSGAQWGCVTGLMAGLACMTRGDGIFVIFALMCFKAWEWYRAKGRDRTEHFKSALSIALVCGACFAVFMTWQLIQTGSPFPGNQVGRRGLALAKHNFSFDHFELGKYVKIVVWNVFQLEELLTLATGSLMLGLVALAFGTLTDRLRGLGIVTILYLGTFFALLVGYQWYFADVHGIRYVNPAAHLFFIFIAALLWNLPAEKYKKPVAIALALWLGVFATYKHYQMHSRLPWAPYMSYLGNPNPAKEKEFWGTMDWMRDNLPPDTLVGIRDYGRASMFADVLIQDIAGNIDPLAAAALEDGTLKQYLKDKNVTYLLIPSPEQRREKLYDYLHANLKLEQVKAAPVAPTQILYKIVW